MRHKLLVILFSGFTAFSLGSCSDFLVRTPDSIMAEDIVYSDPNLIKSVLANYYSRINWGQSVTDAGAYTRLDEAAASSGGPNTDSSYPDDLWRVYDYGLIRNLNQFIAGVRKTTVMSKPDQLAAEGEARFIRAYTYFNMCKCMGGMPIVGDNVYTYESGMDISTIRVARSTEAATYDYIINECTQIANYLPTAKSTNGARATKWAALMLKARAAVYAASIAKHNMDGRIEPISTVGGEVGIDKSLADAYYQTAYATAKAVIDSGGYKLQDVASANKGQNFYNAVCVKENNTEVIWSKDYSYPGSTHGFTTGNMPVSVAEDIDRSGVTPVLNLVEAFEYINDRNGALKLKDSDGKYIAYAEPTDVFANKDPRLWGTIIYPGTKYRGAVIDLQAGRKFLKNGVWTNEVGKTGSVDKETGATITSVNGPTNDNAQYMNKSGFYFRKFLDETPASGTRGRGSDMWFPRFRIAEAYLIAAEAAFETGDQTNAKFYINKVRTRAGIQTIETPITFDDIVQENRVEFAFENHRYWDLKRWRIADKVWNNSADESATLYALFPYVINQKDHPDNGKWVFDKQVSNMAKYPRNFQAKNYYNFLDQGWINNNPLLVKNPFQ